MMEIKHQVFNFSNADNQSNMIVNYSNEEGSAGKDWADIIRMM